MPRYNTDLHQNENIKHQICYNFNSIKENRKFLLIKDHYRFNHIENKLKSVKIKTSTLFLELIKYMSAVLRPRNYN